MHRYATIMTNRPHKAKSSIAIGTTRVVRDEEDIAQDAKNKLRMVLSNGSAPVFPICGAGGKRYNNKYESYSFSTQAYCINLFFNGPGSSHKSRQLIVEYYLHLTTTFEMSFFR